MDLRVVGEVTMALGKVTMAASLPPSLVHFLTISDTEHGDKFG